ncbi:MAG TPA: DUF5667 domain-containing protein, partial [Candidatus Dormibacteraeota bacterium]|nr:DUF5667 domain-containing protein [Candidatus Dormibacteraeota bacterium]
MISESQRLERLAERLRAVEPAQVSPTAKIRAWNLVAADLQKPTRAGLRNRSAGRLVLAGLAAAALLVAGAGAAAADSLPDSALYPVKGALENVEGVFALTASDRFNHHLALAGTRLMEADAMFARHRVDLADQALAGMEDQLTSAASVVKATQAVDPAVSASLGRELQQAVETHDNQLAGLQGHVTNPTAVDAITRARNRAQDALQVAAAPSDQGQGNPNGSPSDKGRAQGGNGSHANSVK